MSKLEWKNEGTVLECRRLPELVIPDTAVALEEIRGDYNSFSELIIPETCVNLRQINLRDCHQLRRLVIPQTAVHLEHIDCSSQLTLTELVIPETCVNLRTINVHGCHELTRLVIPATCTELRYLNCQWTRVAVLPISPSWTELNCLAASHNLTESLIIPRTCTKLEIIYCNAPEVIIPITCPITTMECPNNCSYTTVQEHREFFYAVYKIYYALKKYTYKYRASRKASYTWDIPYHPLCAKFNRQSDQWVD